MAHKVGGAVREAHNETLATSFSSIFDKVIKAGTELNLSNGAAVFKKAKIVFDKLNDSQKSSWVLYQKMANKCYPSPAPARGPIGWKDSELRRVWNGDDSSYRKEPRFLTYLNSMLSQKSLKKELSTIYIGFTESNIMIDEPLIEALALMPESLRATVWRCFSSPSIQRWDLLWDP